MRSRKEIIKCLRSLLAELEEEDTPTQLHPGQEAILNVIESIRKAHKEELYAPLMEARQNISYTSFLSGFKTLEMKFPRRWGKSRLVEYVEKYRPDGVITVRNGRPLPSHESVRGLGIYVDLILIDEQHIIKDVYKWLERVAPALKSGTPLIVRLYT